MTNPEHLSKSTTETVEPTERSHEFTTAQLAAEILRQTPLEAGEAMGEAISQAYFVHIPNALNVNDGIDIGQPLDATEQKYLERLQELIAEGMSSSEAQQRLLSEIEEQLEAESREWDNPTGLVQWNLALTLGGSQPASCSSEGCGHIYEGNSATVLSIDDGKGAKKEGAPEVYVDSSTLHVLESHPDRHDEERVSEQARAIVALKDRTDELRATQA